MMENYMTALNRVFLCTGIMAILTFTPIAIAGVATPGVDQRQENQDRRIEQGVKSGQLTNHEANRLEAQQNRIENTEQRMKSDGVVTRVERTRLAHRENKASRNIYRKKHNFRR
jgi:hypothetical protein